MNLNNSERFPKGKNFHRPNSCLDCKICFCNAQEPNWQKWSQIQVGQTFPVRVPPNFGQNQSSFKRLDTILSELSIFSSHSTRRINYKEVVLQSTLVLPMSPFFVDCIWRQFPINVTSSTILSNESGVHMDRSHSSRLGVRLFRWQNHMIVMTSFFSIIRMRAKSCTRSVRLLARDYFFLWLLSIQHLFY